jgi:hypothetical protein
MARTRSTFDRQASSNGGRRTSESGYSNQFDRASAAARTLSSQYGLLFGQVHGLSASTVKFIQRASSEGARLDSLQATQRAWRSEFGSRLAELQKGSMAAQGPLTHSAVITTLMPLQP